MQETDFSNLNVDVEDMKLFKLCRKLSFLPVHFKSLHTVVAGIAGLFHLLHPLVMTFEMLTTQEAYEFPGG